MNEEKKTKQERTLDAAIKENYKVMANIRRDFDAMKKDLLKFLKECDQTFKLIRKQINEHSAGLERITKINETVEETLGNVYLAIRQNEYLQAYYPEQHGIKAMKVVGVHPAKLTGTNT
jgi:hypothetical protein